MYEILPLLSVCLILVSTYYANKKLKIFSTRPSLLGSFIFLNVYIMIIPGVFLVSVFDQPMIFGVSNAISIESKNITLVYTFFSISILLVFLSLANGISSLDLKLTEVKTNKQTEILLTILSLILVALKILSIGEMPLIVALQGDSTSAAQLKAQIMNNQVGLGGFLLGYIFLHFPVASLVYSTIRKLNGKVDGSLFKYNLIIVFIYSTYDLQKSKFILILFVMFVIYLKQSQKSSKRILFYFPVLSVFIIGLLFTILHDTTFDDLYLAIFQRLFIGQVEGSYMIYDALNPNLDRIFYGAPFGSFFGNSTLDPAAEIINIFFPGADEAWVNSNSYFQAHAWSIFGFSSLLIGPLIVSINIIGMKVLREFFSIIDSGFSRSVYIATIMTLPMNNDFSYFLYFKTFICYSALMIFYLIFITPIKFQGRKIFVLDRLHERLPTSR